MNIYELVKSIIENKIADMHICMPAKIVSYNFVTQKATVQPALNQKYSDDEVVKLPIIHNVPVIHPASGNASITFPVKVNDTVLLVFAERSLEEWLQNGNQVAPDDPRQNDLTDAIALIGLNPFSNPSNAENNDDMLLCYDGSKIRLKPDGVIEAEATQIDLTADEVNITAPDVNIDATNVIVTGKLTAANIEATSEMKSGTAVIGGKAFATHTHGGVTPGPGTTGAVS